MTVGLMTTFSGGGEEQYRAVHAHMRIDENPRRDWSSTDPVERWPGWCGRRPAGDDGRHGNFRSQ